jgi:hypothetical protein
MKLSRERLQREAIATGFRPESLEKVRDDNYTCASHIPN